MQRHVRKYTKEHILYTGRWLFIALCFILCVFGYVCYEKTLVTWWRPVLVSAVVAVSTGLCLADRWRWLTASGNRTVNFLCHLYVVGTLGYAACMVSNYYVSDRASAVREEVVVQKRLKTAHKTYRRLSRNRMVPNGVRYAYAVVVAFADGVQKEIPVSFAEYKRTGRNRKKVLIVEKGLFGMPVIKGGT